MRLHLTRSCPITFPILSKGKRAGLNGGTILSKSLMSMVRRMFCRSLLRVRKEKAKKVCLGPWSNLCGVQGEFRFQPTERRFQPNERKKKSGQMKVFDGSSTVGSGSSFQVPSLSGPVTSQEQGSPVSPQVFSSIPAPRASGHDEFQQALKDPEFAKAVRGLELCLKARERERLRDSGIDSCRVSNAGRQGLRSNSAGGGVGSAFVLVAYPAGESGDHDTACATSAGCWY